MQPFQAISFVTAAQFLDVHGSQGLYYIHPIDVMSPSNPWIFFSPLPTTIGPVDKNILRQATGCRKNQRESLFSKARPTKVSICFSCIPLLTEDHSHPLDGRCRLIQNEHCRSTVGPIRWMALICSRSWFEIRHTDMNVKLNFILIFRLISWKIDI